MQSSHTRIRTVYLHVIPLQFKVETEVNIQVHDTAAEIRASAIALGWGVVGGIHCLYKLSFQNADAGAVKLSLCDAEKHRI